MELSKEWYQRRALIDIIQGAGRVVRSKEDWGNTYILDESFRHLFNLAHDTIPDWWKDAYRVAE
jgi:Rad3-related DNA helicase